MPNEIASLHRAALKRAYRTLAQGLGSSTMVTLLVGVALAVFRQSDDAPETALLVAAAAVATTIITAVASFWQGVAGGLPEATDPPLPHAVP